MNAGINELPRCIWVLWYQGVHQAPTLVTRCIESWKLKNPDWNVVVLDNDNLAAYVDQHVLDSIPADLSTAHRSDLVRLALLAKHGGVWVDATTYCLQPLDSWIDACSSTGVFMFQNPAKDRLISNWFIAAKKNDPIVEGLYHRLTLYWRDNDFAKLNLVQRAVRFLLAKALNRHVSTTRYWFSPFVTRFLGIYPYFVFHYMFAALIRADAAAQQQWQGVGDISARPAHLLRKLGLFSVPTEEAKQRVRDSEAKLFKLTWRYDGDKCRPGTLLYALLEEGLLD